jgi:hypothetical protein
MESNVRNLATEFMDATRGDTFWLKHLLADFAHCPGETTNTIGSNET